MNRKFLEELGLEEEQVNKVMAEHGKSIENFKLENKQLEEQLANKDETITAANKKISEFESMDIDNIKSEVEKWKEKAETIEAESKKKLEEIKFNSILDKKLNKYKVRNNKAAKALLDFDDMKLTDDGIVGLDEQLEELIKSDGYLFELEEEKEEEKKIPRILGGSKGQDRKITREDIRDMTYFERVEFKNKNPEKYDELMK